VRELGSGRGQLLAPCFELVAPTLVAGAGVRTVFIGDALSHGVELVEGAHTVLGLHQTGRP
jgi:hypothetical protein